MRYAAYALARELKCPNVDAMMEEMTIIQFMEWQAFFRIREEERQKDGAAGSFGQGGDSGLQARLVGAFSGYQKRQQVQAVMPQPAPPRARPRTQSGRKRP